MPRFLLYIKSLTAAAARAACFGFCCLLYMGKFNWGAVDKKLTTRHPRVLIHSVKQVQSTIENMPAGKIEQRGYLELEEPRAPARAME